MEQPSTKQPNSQGAETRRASVDDVGKAIGSLRGITAQLEPAANSDQPACEAGSPGKSEARPDAP